MLTGPFMDLSVVTCPVVRLLVLLPSFTLPGISFRPLIYDTFFLSVIGMPSFSSFIIPQIVKMNVNILRPG